jgi:N-acetylglucosaminyldiphosphoundecaprenol N-acetyl-beta-D-mannosaminyltransferase
MERRLVQLLGFNIDTFDFESAVDYAKTLIKSKQGGQIITINPEMIEFALKNPSFAQILNNADLVIPDGVGIKIGLKIKGFNVKRIAGIEFSRKLLEECANNNFSVALIGAKPDVIKKAVETLQSELPNLNIVYVQDGYFQDEGCVLGELAQNASQLILTALGFPRQEEFIKNYRKIHPEAVMIGVGGSFDVWAGNVKRAPVIYQKLGLEWLYRTVKEPYRLKRIFPTLPRFLFRVLLGEKLKG